MGKTVGKILAVAGAVAVTAGAAAGYVFFDGLAPGGVFENSPEHSAQSDTEKTVYDGNGTGENTSGDDTKKVLMSGGLSEDAVFTYEIYNDITLMSDSVKGNCPYELIGKEMSDVKEFYPDWQVTEFSSEAVTLRKNVGSDNNDRYVVGIYEGYVAVFYENSEEGIYMMTEIPVDTLEEDKKILLEEGIYVEGKERLNRILEDYTS